MKYFSTFSGIGGFELGIKQAYVDSIKRSEERGSQEDSQGNEGQRFQSKKRKGTTAKTRQSGQHPRNESNEGQPTCVGYSEIDKYAIELYQKHFPNHKNYGDITKINEKELPDFDLFVGGFPCQSFSIAGKRGGFEDTRGTMFFEIARIVREKQPRLLLLENVKGLLSHDKGNTFFTIVQTLDELGYDIQWQVLNSKNHGVPQNRERVFIIGHLRGTSRPEVFPFGGGNPKNLNQLIGGSQGNRLYGTDGVSVTLASQAGGQGAKTGLYEVDSKIRRLTPTECERLQGFLDGWTEGVSDTQRYKTLGNAVTVNVIRDIMEKLL